MVRSGKPPSAIGLGLLSAAIMSMNDAFADDLTALATIRRQREGGSLLSRIQEADLRRHADRGFRAASSHTLSRPRHTFGSHLVMNGVDLRTQELLNHSTITMTMRYSHLGPTQTRNAVKVLDSVFATDTKTAKCHETGKFPSAKSFVINKRGVAQPG